jgi:hypothetical protein
MTTFNHRSFNEMSDLIARIDTLDQAGVDPAFDSEMEELERQFAELRFAGNY